MIRFDRDRLARLADILAILLAASLPWSTSATGILAGLWLVALLPTLDAARIRAALATPAGGLAVLLWLLGLIGMLWAFGVPLNERIGGLSPFHKLLVIPLLIAQFQRSGRGVDVMKAFLLSCGAMLVFSWFLIFGPSLPWTLGKTPGVPFKDYIAQSAEFTICVFLLAQMALTAWHERRCGFAVLLALVAFVFVANIFYVSTSRTSLVVIPVLALLMAGRQMTWKHGAGLLATAAIAGGLAFAFAPLVRDNVANVLSEVREFKPEGEGTRAGERIEFWRKSIGFLETAPLIGHGTGSIRSQFRMASEGEAGMAGMAAANPHNQTFAVAIQLGLVGAAVLFAMWLAHLMVFRGEGLAAWAGLAIVAQNIVGSLFNSHLFDFTHGWGYVIGVGVAAGMVLKRQRPG